MEIMAEGSVAEIKDKIRELHPTKNIKVAPNRTGGKRVVLVCKDCDFFVVKISRRDDNIWHITEANRRLTACFVYDMYRHVMLTIFLSDKIYLFCYLTTTNTTNTANYKNRYYYAVLNT